MGEDYIDKYLFNYLFNSSKSMISVIDRHYCYVKVNPTFCRMLNLTDGSVVNRSVSDIWGEETFQNEIKNNINLCFNGQTIKFEANFSIPIQGKRFFEVTFVPLTVNSPDVKHIVAETTDITNIKLSQNAVNEMEEEFRRLETGIPIGLLRCKTDGTIMHYNNSFSKIIENYGSVNLQGMNLRDFYLEKSLFDIHIIQLGDKKVRTFGRIPLITMNNNQIFCRVSGFMVSDKNSGLPVFIDFAFEDSSREIMLENRLMQAKKLETVGSLAGGIAHDFNNILGSILGYSEMLLEEVGENNIASEMITRIMKAGTRARELTSQILTFSRQVEQEKISVDIREILEEASSCALSLLKPGITVRKNINNISLQVYADPTQLFRVFMNLITNAINAMERNGGTLSIGLDLAEGEILKKESGKNIVADKYALVTIEDTGIGMEESVISRIFEPYFTTHEVGKGTGLGLSVVYGIVHELEGEIVVKSAKGKGSVFSVYIPVIEDYSAVNLRPAKEAFKILFIAGSCSESRIMSEALKKSGLLITKIHDALELLKLSNEDIHKTNLIVFSDDQKEITSEILIKFISEKNINLPVIMIVDSDYDLSKEKLLNSGIIKHMLFRPVSLREILTAIQISLK